MRQNVANKTKLIPPLTDQNLLFLLQGQLANIQLFVTVNCNFSFYYHESITWKQILPFIVAQVESLETDNNDNILTGSKMSQELPPDAPHSPLISCTLLPLDFLTCDDLLDLKGNMTAKLEIGYGCVAFGGQKYHEVEFTSTKCTALPDIECSGERTFIKSGFPCIKYTNHYFLTTLLYSILLGLAGIDRFCLGHVGAAVGKLLTLGGVGIWWIIDIILLITGQLMPEDGSNWIPYV